MAIIASEFKNKIDSRRAIFQVVASQPNPSLSRVVALDLLNAVEQGLKNRLEDQEFAWTSVSVPVDPLLLRHPVAGSVWAYFVGLGYTVEVQSTAVKIQWG